MEEQNDILSRLGDRLGLNLSFGENGKCCLLLDQTLIISIESKSSGWLFYGLLQSSAGWQEKDFWRDLLALNLSLAEQQAGAIAYEPASDALLYTHRLPAAQLDVDDAYEFLGAFANQLEKVRTHLHSQ
ncbi:chaperone SicP [Castellaniella ginsengisoli]|uniref:Chaperone SicP n=1 Tax=Castellaniella ginsengisoli TaxID=546114 RepID=A0AB39E141_9BURK